MLLNAFTNGFANLLSTRGHKKPRHVEWVFYQNPFDGVTIFEDGWMFEPEVPEIHAKHKIGLLLEPKSLHPRNYVDIMQVINRFEFILTYDEALLNAHPDKFRLCPLMGVELFQPDWGMHPKTKSVGLLTTHKNVTPGHKLRLEIGREFGQQIDVFGLNGWADKAKEYREYRYIVVIEPERIKHLFTPHLLDAVAMGCLPLYWGAPNIGDYLDPDGIIPWSSQDSLRSILREIDLYGESLYTKALPALRRNLERLTEYEFAEDWFYLRYLKGMA